MSAETAERQSAPLLLDTHVVLWATFNDTRLGRNAGRAINLALRENRLAISAITPWEIALLVSKRRINLYKDVLEWVREVLAKPGISLAPLEPEIAIASTRQPFEMHPDPADRILVATARQMGATLVTADQALLTLSKKGHFRAIDARR